MKQKLLTIEQVPRAAFGRMLTDYARAGTPFLQMYSEADYRWFVTACRKNALGVNLPEGMTPYVRYFLLEGEDIVAQGDVRLRTAPELEAITGHLGYGVPPSARGKGYGTLMCARLLEVARKVGYQRVMVSCRVENKASARIIEKNGGQLEDIRYNKKDCGFYRRYWIDLSVAAVGKAQKLPIKGPDNGK